ncbi:efflux RND transporter periplasmic adaptor subunit [Bradyrhizobium sp. USDA 4502]
MEPLVSENQAAAGEAQPANADGAERNSQNRSPAPAVAARSESVLDGGLARDAFAPARVKAPSKATAFLATFGKHVATLAIALAAILVSCLTWQRYVMAPWTRDGTVRVQVANIAPQISGQINHIAVVDNQFVHKGDILYTVDPFDFEVARITGTATVQQRAADLQVKQLQAERRQRLTDLATTPEEQQIYAGNAIQAKAALDAAQQQLAQAEINLRRTKVVSPVNGYVTNLLMRVGDFARAGTSNISIIDTDSFWIDGYFEETKMARVCIGDHAEAKLMGYAQPIIGHVSTVTRGISASNAVSGAQGLPNVDPVYTWVRLAQRVPVRIAIDRIPPGVPLVSGMTATITVRQEAGADDPNWLGRLLRNVGDQLSDLITGPQPRADCLSVMPPQPVPMETIPTEVAPAAKSLDQINPGLAPGVDRAPRGR